MKLGIDFGTTRTRVAAAIDGNYPLIHFQTEVGEGQDWYPSLIAVRGSEEAYGLQAQEHEHDSDWELCRSFKRLLGEGHPESLFRIGQVELPLIEWLSRFLLALKHDLSQHSTLELAPEEAQEVMVGIPANANSNQRFLTLEAFRRAGFVVAGMVNEPSAAGIEYAHRFRKMDVSRRREHVAVYDLGGGTFDVSVISMTGRHHEVLGSEGLSRLGGDDFDEVLLQLALSQPGVASTTQKFLSRLRLLNLCREAKESIKATTRKVTVDLGQISIVGGEVLVSVSDFYSKCEPLVARTLAKTESVLRSVLETVEGEWPSLACLYLVGGASELPVLARRLRDRFGKRVRRSPYPSAATAVGLAIAADDKSGYSLEERFSRYFGVWRESDYGTRIVFDPIFASETTLPAAGKEPLTITRQYHPVHNVGHFRFIECTHLRNGGEPDGDIITAEQIAFPFDPQLYQNRSLEKVPVRPWSEGSTQWIEERYSCDPEGIVQVTISNRTAGYARTYQIRQPLVAGSSPGPAVKRRKHAPH
ncbi:MAG: Hsp70 family protein [Acidobacteriota bacterium]